MKLCHFAVFAAALLFPLAPLSRAADAPVAPSYTSPAIVEIGQLKTVWHDAARQRDVPVNIYYPVAGGPFPLIILSHGLGGSRDGLNYLGQFWAAHGYVCAQLQHIGTDQSVWADAKTMDQAQDDLKRAGGDIENILNRPRDVSFSIDQLLKLNADEKSELKGKINADEIGVAGHSLGGLTALLSAGQRAMGGGFALDLSDPRIKACVAMSAPLNLNAPLSEQFANYKLPTFTLVGANDDTILDATIAHDQIYNAVNAPQQYLLILAGADHMTFAGQRFGLDEPADAHDHALIQTATLAFWQAQLKGNAAARNWLKDDFKNQLGAGSTFKSK